MTRSQHNYHPLSVLMHWASAILVVVCIVAIMSATRLPRFEASRLFLIRLHEVSGALVFALNLLRLAFFHAFGTPSPAGEDVHQVHVARCLHVLLYGTVGFLAVSGALIALNLAAGTSIFGLELPMLLSASGLGLLRQLHQTAGMIFIFICFAHALAGLAIHYLGERETLQRMKIDAQPVDYISAPETDNVRLNAPTLDANETR